MHKRFAWLLSVAIIIGFLMAACRAGDPTDRETPNSGIVTTSDATAAPTVPDLVMCTQYEPDRLLEPATEIGRTLEQLVIQPAFFYGNAYTAQAGHLLSLPSEQDGTVRRNDDGTLSVIVHFRDDVLWSDGEPFKTSDAVLGIRASGSAGPTQVLNVTEGDTLSVFLTMGESTPYPYFPLSTPLPTHVVGVSDYSTVLQAEYARVVNPSLGPYVVTDWRAGQSIRFEANPNFAPPPTYRVVTVQIIPDAMQLVSMLGSGQCQVALDALTAEQIAAIQSAEPGSVRLQTRPSNIYDELVFNTYAATSGRNSYFADVRVRQAVALAFDKAALATSAGLDAAYLMQTWLPADHWAYSATNAASYPVDLTRAASLLDQAGWTDQDGNGVREYHGTGGDYASCQRGEWLIDEDTPFNVSLIYAANNTFMAAAADQVRTALDKIGIAVTVQPIDPPQLFDRSGPVVRRDFDIAIIPSLVSSDPGGMNLWVGEDVYLHPLELTPVRRWQLEERWLTSEQLVEWLAPNNIPSPANDFQGQNYSGWCDDAADVAIVQANRVFDPAARANFYAEHQRLFNAAVPVIPLHLRPHAYAHRPTVCGIDVGPVDPLTWNIFSWRFDPTGACN